MNNKIKLFAVSDIHGNGTLFEEALNNSHFDINNPNHLLIVCGDIFDRGTENRKVYDILMQIPNKILISGNHDIALKRILKNKCLGEYDIYNGADTTIKEFFGDDCIDGKGRIKTDQKISNELEQLIDSSVDYFETGNYVFVHGWIPTSMDVEPEWWQREWRNAPMFVWNECRFSEWYNMYKHKLLLPNKTIVCGHRSASYGTYFDKRRNPNSNSPFYGENIIAIDADTFYTGKVNVVVLEDTLISSRCHQMTLNDEYFLAVKNNRKTVELRVRDEKRKQVRIGDTIVFSKKSDPEQKVIVRVKGCYLYESFESLVDDFTADELGFKGKPKKDIVKLANSIYDYKKTRKYGAFAIKFERVK